MRKLGRGLLAGVGVISLVCVILGPLLAYLQALPPIQGFALYALGSILGLVAAVTALIVYLRKGRGWAPALGLLGAPGALALIYTVVSTFGVPPINDISTDLISPPAFQHAQTLPENEGRDLSFPPENRAVIEDGYPDLTPLGLAQSANDAFLRISDLVRAEPGWEVTSVRVDGRVSHIEGTATSPIFRFVDDFVIRVTESTNGAAVVDMRSKSRDGKSDLGANAERIRAFFEKLSPGLTAA
jgi:uncharacterized protein (DUF1499 family)